MKQAPKEIAIDVSHHLVYAEAAGAVCDELFRATKAGNRTANALTSGKRPKNN